MPMTKQRILCIDDHDDTRFMLTSLLGQKGYAAQSAGTAVEALKLAGSNGFDLYVVDSYLPDSDGIELCRQLRSLHSDMPIVIYTGEASAEHHRRAMEAGATAYVTKPNIAGLISTLKELL